MQVDYYGAPTQLKALANITAPESSLLVVAPFDKGSMDVIEKAIMTANLGLTPNNDGKVIRINVPQLTAVRLNHSRLLHCARNACKILQNTVCVI